MSFVVGSERVREFDIELAAAEPDYWAFADVGAFTGQQLVIEVSDPEPVSSALSKIYQANTPVEPDSLYLERHRPQFHFSSRRGWNNDPNGLVYYADQYRLYYQHNPYGAKWGNMHWGHAVSPDLVHWQELGDAMYPDHLGTIFTGSGVVDWNNTSELQDGDQSVVVFVYTSAGDPFVQSIAYSNDGGRSLTKYASNPVMGHIVGRNRDPKVVWHEPTEHWVMALYLEANDYALFASPDLKRWTQLCDIQLPGCTECPDLFDLPVDGDPADTRWVFWGANGTYLLGQFDGATFEQEGDPLRYDWGGDSYAAQTWSDIPEEDGRRIQIAWLRVDLPDMPFNQQMTFPCELTLRRTAEGIRLFSQPVEEIEGIREQRHSWRALTLQPGDDPLTVAAGDLLDVQVELAQEGVSELVLKIKGVPIVYDADKQQLSCDGRVAPLRLAEGRIRLRVLADRASFEIFGNDGEVALPIGLIPRDWKASLEISCRGGIAMVNVLDVYELRSAWR